MDKPLISRRVGFVGQLKEFQSFVIAQPKSLERTGGARSGTWSARRPNLRLKDETASAAWHPDGTPSSHVPLKYTALVSTKRVNEVKRTVGNQIFDFVVRGGCNPGVDRLPRGLWRLLKSTGTSFPPVFVAQTSKNGARNG